MFVTSSIDSSINTYWPGCMGHREMEYCIDGILFLFVLFCFVLVLFSVKLHMSANPSKYLSPIGLIKKLSEMIK